MSPSWSTVATIFGAIAVLGAAVDVAAVGGGGAVIDVAAAVGAVVDVAIFVARSWSRSPERCS